MVGVVSAWPLPALVVVANISVACTAVCDMCKTSRLSGNLQEEPVKMLDIIV